MKGEDGGAMARKVARKRARACEAIEGAILLIEAARSRAIEWREHTKCIIEDTDGG